jgi:hypothetical protein
MREISKKTTDTVATKAPKTKVTAKPTNKTKTRSKQAASKKTTTTAQKEAKKTPGVLKKSQLPPIITPEERWKMISEAAYYIAEKRDFQNSNPEEDWLQAEAQIDTILVTAKK